VTLTFASHSSTIQITLHETLPSTPAESSATPSFTFAQHLRVIIDQALNDYEVVWAAAGHPHAVFPTTYSELLKYTRAKAMAVGD
jgi:prolyl-tRNA editing enzyme YbaK/EbsC (Cys-tRNA(Pro) deacylase)